MRGWAACAWRVWQSIYELYERILNTWESGMAVTPGSIEDADKNIMKEGG